ncbi:MAG: heparan-alpha-glucosaminide N-acetyltransferase domain-containing protein [Bryobacteraceae bacterium]
MSSSSQRVVFLDWMRGVAAIIMLQGHTFDAFASPETRQGSAYIFSQFFGGEAAAIFLLLTGVTYGLGMNRRQHLPPAQRVIAALKRARYLFVLAVLFRLQSWLFSMPHSDWHSLLKVDVLNLMGTMAAMLSVLALFEGVRRIRWAVLIGALIAAFSPLVSGLDLSAMPVWLRDYIVPGAINFGIFPWGAFLAFGVAVGSMIPLVERGAWNRVMQWSALCGFGLLLGGQYFSNLPFSLYSNADFWLNSPALISCKLGIALLLGAGAFLWTEFGSLGWSWVQQLGTTSLVVYWVHVELVYGNWFKSFQGRLTTGQCLLFAACLIPAMVALSVAVKRLQWGQMLRKIGIPIPGKPVPVQSILTTENGTERPRRIAGL